MDDSFDNGRRPPDAPAGDRGAGDLPAGGAGLGPATPPGSMLGGGDAPQPPRQVQPPAGRWPEGGGGSAREAFGLDDGLAPLQGMPLGEACHEAVSLARQCVRQHPLASVGVGLLIGFILGRR